MPPFRYLLIALLFTTASVRAGEFVDVVADPAEVRLEGPTARFTLLVHGRKADGRLVDLTRIARYRVADGKIATLTSSVVAPVADGKTTIAIEADGKTLSVAVTVCDATAPRRFNFENDVVPILSRYGCNSSGCHGKAEGQNGFKLSVFGFDPLADLNALTKEGRGRRVFPPAPKQSLLLRKMSGQIVHGGGGRIPEDSADYETIRAWIAAGTPFGSADDPKVVAVRVEPRERVLTPHGIQQLRVVVRYSNGREADVTSLARFQSNNDGVAYVQPSGLVLARDVPGEAAILAGYLNEVDVFRAVVPRQEQIAKYPELPTNNFIDGHVWKKLQKLNVLPSEPCDDAEYVRRVYLDVIGTLPTPDETRRFLTDKRPDRRARLVDELLERPEFADYWALQWADLLRVDRQTLGPKRAYAYYQWIRAGVAANRPFDQFARELLTVPGSQADAAPANFYRVVTKPGETASTVAQVFLGIRIACAECHHHPFDRWSQTDYFGMQAYFAGGSAKHTRTGEEVIAHPLGEAAPKTKPAGDLKTNLADWLTRPDNPYFARNLSNRVWAHFLGRGLIEPVDDVRTTNPPTNPELLDALAKHLVDSKYDLKALIRAITASRVYQLSSQPNATNERDEQNYSRALLKRIPAEVLLDMVSQSTGVPERFGGVPLGTRAIQLWDSRVSHYFLKTFGRPERISACECERNHEPSVSQVLHLLNSPEIQAKLSHEGGHVAKWVRQLDDGAIVDEMYLTFYSRPPSDAERKKALAFLEKRKDRRRQAVEDLAWSLLNSLEFAFNH